jgi:hypothetical protein
MHRVCLLMSLVVLGGWLEGRARASISYQYVTDATNYNAVAGTNVTANVYLEETVTGSDTSFIAAQHGLFNAGFGTKQTGTVPTGASTISQITPNTQTEPAGFQGPTSQSVSATRGWQLEGTSLGDTTAGPSGTTAGGSVTTVGGTTTTKVFLGTITLTAGTLGTTTTFTIQSKRTLQNDPGDGNTLTFNGGFDLDKDSSGQGAPVTWTGADAVGANNTFTVTAVPEPSSLLLCGLAVCGGAFAAYRRRKAVAASGLALGVWRRWRNRATGKA